MDTHGLKFRHLPWSAYRSAGYGLSHWLTSLRSWSLYSWQARSLFSHWLTSIQSADRWPADRPAATSPIGWWALNWPITDRLMGPLPFLPLVDEHSASWSLTSWRARCLFSHWLTSIQSAYRLPADRPAASSSIGWWALNRPITDQLTGPLPFLPLVGEHSVSWSLTSWRARCLFSHWLTSTQSTDHWPADGPAAFSPIGWQALSQLITDQLKGPLPFLPLVDEHSVSWSLTSWRARCRFYNSLTSTQSADH
jgi:hypothetical protein